MMRLAVLLLLLVSSAFSSSPLIMKHADSLNVARTRGILHLQGRVLFVHDSIEFRTQHATWNKDAEMVTCNGGFLFTHPSGFIHAHEGIYQKKNSMATARGDVNAGDSARTYAFKGEYLIYDREQEILTMPDRPRLFQFETRKDSTIDTVKIEARRIIFNKKESFAEAYKNVKLTQKDMIVTCDTGYFDRKNNWLSLTGHPTCDMLNYHLTGDSIFMVLDSTGKQLKSALVIRNAHGVQKEEDKQGTPGHVTEAFGDTLFAEFDDGKIERLYVNLNARGFFYENDLKEYRNLMDGDRLDLYFKKGKMDRAVVAGRAQSTYFFVKKDRTVAGKNEATGDTIHLLFDAQKNAVKSLRLLGGGTMASGRYVDMEKLARQKKAAELDSISKLAKDRIAKAAAKNDSTGKAVVPDAAEKVVTPAAAEKVVAPAPKGKGAPAPAPKRTAPMENSTTRKDPASKAAPEPKNATEPKSSPAPAPKKQPASTEGKS
ncbi:hypothetical protein [uncultured Fibrobacter sp.]|uniref:hypothetical protein n=1 Tax=uncultured Fibrobacter sp. TaxID=261512 RepID=UPI0025F91AA2|nr:hypothetical protein [uncultured Fibrobacter sp.]MBR3669064.1 hypothetical protein [Fibrobacter sp.]